MFWGLENSLKYIFIFQYHRNHKFGTKSYENISFQQCSKTIMYLPETEEEMSLFMLLQIYLNFPVPNPFQNQFIINRGWSISIKEL